MFSRHLLKKAQTLRLLTKPRQQCFSIIKTQPRFFSNDNASHIEQEQDQDLEEESASQILTKASIED
jgi:hypothetical protein